MTLSREAKKLMDGKDRTAEEALKIMRECEATPRLAELAQHIQQLVSLKQIAEIIAERIHNGSAREKREYATAYIDMLIRLEKLQGEVTADDVSKLADEEIDAILKLDYRIAKVRKNKPRIGAAS